MTESEWLASNDPAAMLGFLNEHRAVGTEKRWVDANARRLRLFACACCRSVWPMLTDPRSRRAVEVAERFADGLATSSDVEEALQAVSEGVRGGPIPVSEYSLLWEVSRAIPSIAAENAVRLSLGELKVAATRPRQCAELAALLREIVGNPFLPVTLPRDERPCPDCPPGRPDENCDDCAGSGIADFGPCPWLTPLVVDLAGQCYDKRQGWRVCERCKGYAAKAPEKDRRHMCGECHGTGHTDDGTGHLDPLRLAVLSDALEDAGCDDGTLLRHLRHGDTVRRTIPVNDGHPTPLIVDASVPHVRGCWALDLILNKE